MFKLFDNLLKFFYSITHFFEKSNIFPMRPFFNIFSFKGSSPNFACNFKQSNIVSIYYNSNIGYYLNIAIQQLGYVKILILDQTNEGIF